MIVYYFLCFYNVIVELTFISRIICLIVLDIQVFHRNHLFKTNIKNKTLRHWPNCWHVQWRHEEIMSWQYSRVNKFPPMNAAYTKPTYHKTAKGAFPESHVPPK